MCSPAAMNACFYNLNLWHAQVSNGCFPQPRLQCTPDSALRDITFTLVEGDFQVCRTPLV